MRWRRFPHALSLFLSTAACAQVTPPMTRPTQSIPVTQPAKGTQQLGQGDVGMQLRPPRPAPSSPAWPRLTLVCGYQQWIAGGRDAVRTNLRSLPIDEIVLATGLSYEPDHRPTDDPAAVVAALTELRDWGVRPGLMVGGIANNLNCVLYSPRAVWDQASGTVTLSSANHWNWSTLNPDDQVVTFQRYGYFTHTTRVTVVSPMVVTLETPIPAASCSDVFCRWIRDVWYYHGHGQSHWAWTSRPRWQAFADFVHGFYELGYYGPLHIDCEPNFLLADSRGPIPHVSSGERWPQWLWPLIADAADPLITWLRDEYPVYSSGAPLTVWPARLEGNFLAGMFADLACVDVAEVDEHTYTIPTLHAERAAEIPARLARARPNTYRPGFYPEILLSRNAARLTDAKRAGVERAVIYIDGGWGQDEVNKLFSAEWRAK